MQFDDMLATVLTQPRDTIGARIALWRQLVDLLAQRDDIASDPAHIEAFALLDRLQIDVPNGVRADAARALAGRHIPAWLFVHFSDDEPEIARPVLLEARLDDDDWAEILPTMRSSSRALLRHRANLPAIARRILDQLGSSDMVLESSFELTEIVGEGNDGETAAAPTEEIVDLAEPADFDDEQADAVDFDDAWRDFGLAAEDEDSEDEPAEPADDAGDAENVVTPFRTPPSFSRRDEADDAGRESGEETEGADILELDAASILPELPDEQVSEPDVRQIKALVERIEAYRKSRSAAPDQAAATPEPLTEFRFEAGPDGVVRWVEGAPRGPLIGQSIAFSADALDFGVDGHAAGAFRQRAPFRDARLIVAGEGPAAGAWRISAVPFFDEHDGRFAGYRGAARRPRREEEAAIGADRTTGLFGSSLPPDSLRQLVHEFRTPLNAIIGFAEMIEGQLLGPVSEAYRDRAKSIAREATGLLKSVDDLDTAARAETERLTLAVEAIDAVTILRRVEAHYAAHAAERGVGLVVDIEGDIPQLAADPIATERMFERLLSATVGLAASGETIAVRCTRSAQPHRIEIAFSRPRLLEGLAEDALLDPGYSPDGDWPDAPALGLGFALRLVRNIAAEAQGRMIIEDDRFVLLLPDQQAAPAADRRDRDL